MSDSVIQPSLLDVISGLHQLVDVFQNIDLTRTTDPDLLAVHREFERLRRRLDPAEYRLIVEENHRKLPDEYGFASTGRFLRHLLTIDPSEASARGRAADAAGPRTALTGEQLAPVFEAVAAAQLTGAISQRHALLIEKTIDDLPDAVQAVEGEQAERDLVRYASQFDPRQLSVLARRMSNCLNPDGVFTEPADQQRRRDVTMQMRADGGSRWEADATPELTQRMLAYFDTHAAPRPADSDGVKDSRTAGQRRHDALLDLFESAQRSDDAPSNNGVSMTIVVNMTIEQYLSGQGLARTNHGALVPVSEALRWCGGDAEVLALAINSMKAITHYGGMHRIFTRNQRIVMAARDGGCTFPGCPEPPGRCQADHVTRWEHGGRSRVDNGALRCRYHHRLAEQLGYRPTMIDGRPHWIPPEWVDPAQRPVRNTLHDTNPAA
jgi:hypothetical protein